MTGGIGYGTKIVKTWSNSSCQTGDYFIRTEDGSVWKAELSPRVLGTGEVGGKMRDGKAYR